MIDNIVWLEQQRDLWATLRDEAYAAGDWATGIKHDELVMQFYAAVVEIREARKRLAVMSEVLVMRVLLAAKDLHEPL